jgi:8-amino-7-oxononanoate synthase
MRPPSSLSQFAEEKLNALEARNRRRTLVDTWRKDGMNIKIGASDLMVSFTDNDYLGLSTHPAVIEAATTAMRIYGAGAGASRLVTGNYPIYRVLERKIAEIKGTEDAVVFGSGYLANVGIIPSLVGKDDLILADELVHTCIHAGMDLAHSTVKIFRHNDTAHAAELLAALRGDFRKCLIVVDGVYSMDGDIAPLRTLGELAAEHDAWLMSDDAHGLGTIGGGRGAAHACNAAHLVPLQMGTLSKAVGSYGGYLAAAKPVVDLMRTRARSFIYTTGMPPAAVGAAIKSLEIIQSDTARVARPVRLAQKFAEALGLPKPQTPIVPLVIGSEKDALEASDKLASQGFKATAFRPPTVPEGTSRLRFSFSASHRDEDVARLIKVCLKLKLVKKK